MQLLVGLEDYHIGALLKAAHVLADLFHLSVYFTRCQTTRQRSSGFVELRRSRSPSTS